MKLQQVQATFGDGAGDQGFFRVHKHADAQNECGQGMGNFRSLRYRDMARALFVKIQPDHVRAGSGGGQRISDIGDAAYFHPRTHGRFI